jgi:hypothetical protein
MLHQMPSGAVRDHRMRHAVLRLTRSSELRALIPGSHQPTRELATRYRAQHRSAPCGTVINKPAIPHCNALAHDRLPAFFRVIC